MENKGKTAVEQRFAPAVKKILSLLLAAAMLFSITAGIELSAYAATSGDYEYEILDDGTVEITEYSGSAKNLAIPGTIAGKTVSRIGDLAFSGCETLTNVIIPSSVTSLGDGVFYECEYLESIDVDSSNKNYSSKTGILYNKSKTELITYPAGKHYTSFTIPNTVTSIAEMAFYGSSLESVTIPNGVTSIGDGVFANCTYLNSVTIPNSVTSIGEMVFYQCQALSSMTIPNSVESIGEMAFSYTDLGEITIPCSVSSIGGGAFFGCSGLESIIVDSKNKNYSSTDGVLYNKNKTELIQYPVRKEVDLFTVPNGVTSIAEGAFSWNYYLSEVILPNSLKSIGDGAFCYGRLDRITIPSSVTNIGELAFFGCDGLGVKIYSKNVKIGEYAFSGDTLIYGYKGSTAESYAEEYGFRFVALSESGKLETPKLRVIVNSDGTFTLSWNKIIESDKYEIYLLGTNGSYSLMKTVTDNSYITAIAQYGKKYTYKVRAVNGKSSSAFSSEVSATNNKKLQPPTPKATVNSNGSFTLSWNKIAGADHYQIHLLGADGIYRLMATTTATSYTTAVAPYGKQYSYKVIAVNNKNDSACSVFSSAVNVTNNKKLQAPTLKVTVNTNGTFKLSWNKVSGAEKYELYIKQADGSYKLMKTTTGTSFTTAVAAYGKQYSYKMKAVKGSTKSSYSNTVNATNNKKLQTPTLKAIVNANGTFKLSWNKVAGADKYELYIKQADGSYKLMKTTTATSFTTAFATYGKQFSYKMRAVNSKNKSLTSAYSSVVNATNNKKLQTPTMKASVNANGTFKLSWNKVAGADKYELYIKQANGSYKLMKTTTATSFTTAFATYGKQFSYKMRAVNSKNSSAASSYSAVVNAKNTKKLQTPAMKVTVNTNGSFKLSWNKVEGATSYQLYIKQANGSYKLMKTTTSTSFTTAVATKGKTYSYKMVAVTSKNKNATSNYSNVVNAKRK